MTEHDRPFDSEELHVPPKLQKDLRALFKPPGAVPQRVDKTVIEQAHRRLTHPRRLIIPMRWTAAVAAAAVITISVILLQRLPSPNHQSSIISHQSYSAGRADIDGNGRVDILDAFRLARHVESRGQAQTQWDLNGDGLVDRKDVDLVAFAAVRLDKGV